MKEKEKKDLAKPNDTEMVIVEEFDADRAIKRVKEFVKFIDGIRSILKEGEDFAKRKGYPKPSLEKPGAEKVIAALNCSPKIVSGEDGKLWNTEYGLKEYSLVLHLIDRKSGIFVGGGVGYARAEMDDLKTYNKETGQRDINKGRVSWANNKALKMAYKSALICAALSVGALSGYFTQDIDSDNKSKSNTATDDDKPQLATDKQVHMILSIQKSHLLHSFEHYLIQKKLNDGMSKKDASGCIEWWIGKDDEPGARSQREEFKKQGKEALDKHMVEVENTLKEKHPNDYKEFLATLKK